jgi:hypothetical protein
MFTEERGTPYTEWENKTGKENLRVQGEEGSRVGLLGAPGGVRITGKQSETRVTLLRSEYYCTLEIEAARSFETSVNITRIHGVIKEYSVLHSHSRGNVKSHFHTQHNMEGSEKQRNLGSKKPGFECANSEYDQEFYLLGCNAI